ncbi:nudix hydrolase 25-like [Quercus lobata]|uniref:nudix hydrolase 25-like n=2 Tax=Quercus lobata TaxID=97700 RepID=UPI001245B4AF|nr:nudix hydrolase 25-like [Quercus lobata]
MVTFRDFLAGFCGFKIECSRSMADASDISAEFKWLWDLQSQGGIEDGEEPKSAAIRELREETGIVSAEIMAEVPNWLTYDFPPAVKAKVNRLWGGEWHGQAQKWFLMRLTKDESEINLANGEAEPEFAEWKWAGPEEVVEQAVDYKRPTYEEVMRTFEPYLSGNSISTKCKSSKW